MIETLRNNRVFVHLLKHGLLTGVQVDTMLSSRSGRKLARSVLLRSRTSVSKGAFLRSLRQGERNVEIALYTLLLVRYLHLLDSNNWSQFVRISELMDQVGSTEIDDEASNRLLRAMSEFVSDLSKNRNVIV